MIEVKNLNKTYDRHRQHENHVLRDISLTLPDTGFVCILGPSGCGKTSLLNAIGGLDTFESGTVRMGDFSADRKASATSDANRNKNFGYIFQNYYLLQNHSVGYNVYLGMHSMKLKHSEKLRRVRDALKAVDMDRYIRRNVAELSGGQQQRVAIARTLARKPKVILADEPTGNLDEANTHNICTLLRKISKTSLVLMVTHEQRVARCYADRIISLDNGIVAADETDWEREYLPEEDAATMYTGDFTREVCQQEGIALQLYRQEGAAPVSIAVMVLKDQIVIKLEDVRTVSCGGDEDRPIVVDGPRPHLTLEDVDRDVVAWQREDIPSKPGWGIRLGDMLKEAAAMSLGKGFKSIGTKIFLVLLTVLMAIGIGDYLKLQSIDPEDFIQTHSQALQVRLTRGSAADSNTIGLLTLSRQFKEGLAEVDVPFTFVPYINHRATIDTSSFPQTGDLEMVVGNCNYMPVQYLDEADLIAGRMPQTGEEVVMDRWILDRMLEEDGVARNGIKSRAYFLGRKLIFGSEKLALTIVGISDSGEPAAYMLNDAMASLGVLGTHVASLSALQAKYPGKYDDVVLAEDECIVLPNNAGSTYRDKVGAHFTTKGNLFYTIVMSIEETDFYPKIVVADSQIDKIIYSMSYEGFWLLTEDKAALVSSLREIESDMGGVLQVKIYDSYTTKMEEYIEASRMRADARTILTVTIIVMSIVMLYLLRRSQVFERIGMLAVYRLLGVPSRKVVGIFVLESLLSTLSTSLPAAILTWGVIRILGDRVEILLPWQAAGGVCLSVMVFHLLVTVLPMIRLLLLPPAKLANQYDF